MNIRPNKAKQLSLPILDFSEAVNRLAQSCVEARGAVFTKRVVVEFILDLARYTIDQPLHRFRLLEPSFGDGSFLLVVVERLLIAYAKQASDRARIVEDLSNAIRALEPRAIFPKANLSSFFVSFSLSIPSEKSDRSARSCQ